MRCVQKQAVVAGVGDIEWCIVLVLGAYCKAPRAVGTRQVTVKIWTSEAKEDNIEAKTSWVSLRSRNRAVNRGAGDERTCRHNAAGVPDDVRSRRGAANRGAGGERSYRHKTVVVPSTKGEMKSPNANMDHPMNAVESTKAMVDSTA
ncbi:hypothetical protein PI124_g4875 [Phytophthora idaei]|nr:hypothetical protein PI125_g21660 [Phytophthora idaei]KAG3250464.1 hypothetical protein PI124_g4875 [Phytophthora idaei]